MMCCQMVSQPIFHECQIVECIFILHKTQDLNQSYFSKLVVLSQLVCQNGGLVIFIHNLEIKFLLELSTIIGSALQIMFSWKNEDFTSKLL